MDYMIALAIITLLFSLYIFFICKSKNRESFNLKEIMKRIKIIQTLSTPNDLEGFTEILSHESKIINNLKEIKKLKNENDSLFKFIQEPSSTSSFSYDIINKEVIIEEESNDVSDEKSETGTNYEDDDVIDYDDDDDEITGFIEPFTNNFVAI